MPDLSALIDAALRWMEPFYQSYGYVLVLLGALLEHTFFLAWAMPGGILVALGGLYAQAGILSLPAVVLLAMTGFMLGDHIDYLVGRRSSRTLHRLTRGKLAGTTVSVRKATLPLVVLAYINAIPRAAMFMGGAARGMSYWRFLLLSMCLSAFWSTVFTLLGYFLGSNRERLSGALKAVGAAGQLVILIAIAAIGFYMIRERRRRGSAPAA